jgi:hypothetical protein
LGQRPWDSAPGDEMKDSIATATAQAPKAWRQFVFALSAALKAMIRCSIPTVSDRDVYVTWGPWGGSWVTPPDGERDQDA